MPIVSVPKILRSKLGDDGAEALVEFFNEMQAANSPKEEIIEIVEEKFERRLAEELGKLRIEMAEMKSELRNEMGNMESRLNNKILELQADSAKKHADLIKWMFIFWVGQIGVFVGILLAFFK
jgi:hypothetical protein